MYFNQGSTLRYEFFRSTLFPKFVHKDLHVLLIAIKKHFYYCCVNKYLKKM